MPVYSTKSSSHFDSQLGFKTTGLDETRKVLPQTWWISNTTLHVMGGNVSLPENEEWQGKGWRRREVFKKKIKRKEI